MIKFMKQIYNRLNQKPWQKSAIKKISGFHYLGKNQQKNPHKAGFSKL